MPPPRIALNACLPPDRLLRVVGELGATLRCLKVSVKAEERDGLKVVTLRDTQFWWARKDLNLGPMDYESTALTAELRARSSLVRGGKYYAIASAARVEMPPIQ